MAWHGRRGYGAEAGGRSDEADTASGFRGASAAVAEDDSFSGDLVAEFDRRVARQRDEQDAERLFSLAAFDGDAPAETSGEETLAQTLAAAGSMPPEVAEECVRGLLASLRSAHQARWSHGELSLGSFSIDAAGRISLRDAGMRQKNAWLQGSVDGETLPLHATGELDRRWNEAFLDSAADDLRRLASDIAPSLASAIEGPAPEGFDALRTRLDAVDGTIATIDDLEHAWRTIEAAFDKSETSVDIASEESFEANESTPAPDSPIDETAQDLPQPTLVDAPSPVGSMSGAALLWLCVAGGLAVIAGAAATAIGRL